MRAQILFVVPVLLAGCQLLGSDGFDLGLVGAWRADEPPTAAPASKHADTYTYTLAGNWLILAYLSYPADAPVDTRHVYRRQ